MKKIFALIISLMLISCASSGTQISQSVATSFKEGVTTENEIIAALGNPTSVTISGDTKIISYAGFQYQAKAASFVPVVGLFAGGVDYSHTVAMYFIDKQGILTKMNYTSSGAGSRQGVTVAPSSPQEPKAIQ